MLQTGMPIVYSNSAIITVVQADSTSTGLPNIIYQIVSG
jgi:hypothetical protein